MWYNVIAKQTWKEVSTIARTYRPTGVTDEVLEAIRRAKKEIFGVDDESLEMEIITTDKMTPEEKRFERISGWLKQGLTMEEAEKLADEAARVDKTIEEMIEEGLI